MGKYLMKRFLNMLTLICSSLTNIVAFYQSLIIDLNYLTNLNPRIKSYSRQNKDKTTLL